MNPNENQQSPFTPVDYLDQIAPKSSSKLDFLRSKPIFLGIIAIIILVLFIFISSVISSSGSKPTEQLAARLTATETVVSDASSKIQSSQLISFNSNLDIYLINTIRDITPLLAKENIKIDKLSKSVTTAESNVALLSKLEDARLNATYDRTYAREISYKLDTILTLMQQIYSSTSNSSLKSFLENSYKNLTPTQKQFSDFNAADS
jgi:hypothetical protein